MSSLIFCVVELEITPVPIIKYELNKATIKTPDIEAIENLNRLCLNFLKMSINARILISAIKTYIQKRSNVA